MPDMRDIAAVARQYADGDNLSVRAGLHDQYSVNPVGLAPWLFDQYRLAPGERVLELGCGTASQWKGRLSALPAGCSLVLSDLSPGMVEAVRAAYGGEADVEQIDIRQIPYPGGLFDAVIANFMLYHVPDLPRAFAEVRRVLKPGGRFYAATNGDGGLTGFMREAMERCGLDAAAFPRGFSFSLQNGAGQLRQYFALVERRDYPDGRPGGLGAVDRRDDRLHRSGAGKAVRILRGHPTPGRGDLYPQRGRSVRLPEGGPVRLTCTRPSQIVYTWSGRVHPAFTALPPFPIILYAGGDPEETGKEGWI